jgi:hypothetical protein
VDLLKKSLCERFDYPYLFLEPFRSGREKYIASYPIELIKNSFSSGKAGVFVKFRSGVSDGLATQEEERVSTYFSFLFCSTSEFGLALKLYVLGSTVQFLN